MIPLSYQFSYCIIKEVCHILCAQDLSRIEVKTQRVESPTSLSGNFFVPVTEDKERCRSPELLYPPIANIAEVFNVFVTTLCCILNRGRISSVQERKWDIEGILGRWPGYVNFLKSFLEVVSKRKSIYSDVRRFKSMVQVLWLAQSEKYRIL